MIVKAFFIVLMLLEFSYLAQCTTIWEMLVIDGVEADTGYSWDVLEYIFLAYHDDIISPKKCGRREPCREHMATWDHIYFFLLFV